MEARRKVKKKTTERNELLAKLGLFWKNKMECWIFFKALGAVAGQHDIFRRYMRDSRKNAAASLPVKDSGLGLYWFFVFWLIWVSYQKNKKIIMKWMLRLARFFSTEYNIFWINIFLKCIIFFYGSMGNLPVRRRKKPSCVRFGSIAAAVYRLYFLSFHIFLLL